MDRAVGLAAMLVGVFANHAGDYLWVRTIAGPFPPPLAVLSASHNEPSLSQRMLFAFAPEKLADFLLRQQSIIDSDVIKHAI